MTTASYIMLEKISEYLACHIIKTLGLKVQDTLLGTYLKINDKKINYLEFISSLENGKCNHALARIFPKIKLEKILKYSYDNCVN